MLCLAASHTWPLIIQTFTWWRRNLRLLESPGNRIILSASSTLLWPLFTMWLKVCEMLRMARWTRALLDLPPVRQIMRLDNNQIYKISSFHAVWTNQFKENYRAQWLWWEYIKVKWRYNQNDLGIWSVMHHPATWKKCRRAHAHAHKHVHVTDKYFGCD